MIELLEAAAATHRISRLIVTDSLFEPVRDAWVKLSYALAMKPEPEPSEYKELAEVAMDDPNRPKMVELAACVHCVGVWAAVLVLVLRKVKGGRGLVRLLAVAGVHSAWAELAHG